MRYLIFGLLFTHSLFAQNRAFELNEGRVFSLNLNNSTYTLNTSPALGMITEFVGPCGSSTCEIPALTPFTVSYSVSGATNCIGTGGVFSWHGVREAADGQYEFDIPFITNDTTFYLTCSNNTKEHVLRIDVTANEQMTSCSTDDYPPGLSVEGFTYPDVNEGLDFGQSTNTTVELSVQNNEFFAISGFHLTAVNMRRRIIFEQAPTNYNLIDQGTFSVSECPGDFTQSATCQKTFNNFTTALFSTNPADNPAVFCILDPNKSYFINFLTSPDPYNEAPTCASGSDTICTIFYTEAAL